MLMLICLALQVLIFRTAILESIKTLLEARKKQEEVVMKALSGELLSSFRYFIL